MSGPQGVFGANSWRPDGTARLVFLPGRNRAEEILKGSSKGEFDTFF